MLPASCPILVPGWRGCTCLPARKRINIRLQQSVQEELKNTTEDDHPPVHLLHGLLLDSFEENCGSCCGLGFGSRWWLHHPPMVQSRSYATRNRDTVCYCWRYFDCNRRLQCQNQLQMRDHQVYTTYYIGES